MSLFDDLYKSLERRIRVMQQNGNAHMVGLTTWLAIETYTRTPGHERLTRWQADELYELLEPMFTKTPPPTSKPPFQDKFDAKLMRREKERRTSAYRATGRTWFNQPLVAA
jgi:hypothetical protein